MQQTRYFCFFLCFLLYHCTPSTERIEEEVFPNIIYILADDLGYGDLSCNNENSKIKTLNIDRLAGEGMLFTDAHSGSSVCTPTRYGILTGRYAWRTRLQRGVTWSYDRHLIDTDRQTVADILKDKGYATACIGKWHLGLDWGMNSRTGLVDFFNPINNGPKEYGFDYFFGIAASLDIPPYLYIENDRITATTIDTISARSGKAFWRESPIGDDFEMEGVLPKLTEKAVTYIDEQAKNDDPFFLYFPLPAPHTPILPTEKFQGSSGTNEYGDFVVMVDDVVKQVMETLDRNGIADNTLIIFTSDNGCSPVADFEELASFGHQPSYIYRGHKADIYEGGHRVPFIVKWTGNIEAGSRSEETICLTDFLRTAAAIVGEQLPDEVAEDSYDLLAVLQGETYKKPLRETTVHHSVNGSFAIRHYDWKLNFCAGSGGWSYPTPKQIEEEQLDLPPFQLYNLKTDPAEKNNLMNEHPEIVDSLTKLMQKLVEDGRSKQGEVQTNDRDVEFVEK